MLNIAALSKLVIIISCFYAEIDIYHEYNNAQVTHMFTKYHQVTTTPNIKIKSGLRNGNTIKCNYIIRKNNK